MKREDGLAAGAAPLMDGADHVSGFKHDSHAREIWGDAYDAIPKSVFATLAHFLAARCADDREQIDALILAELDALSGQIMPERQARAAIKAIRKATTA